VVFPPNTNIVTVLRDGQALVPRGETAFQQDDTVLALAHTSVEGELRRTLLGGE
jgi:Trk K+ transport system NAD-binding subunit